ncbi:MAG TPA: endonuclease domain-containing protein [Armatimonadota bacterium]|jgi:very-short-patch-repair endonuclease
MRDTRKVRGTTPDIIAAAQSLRAEMTPAESALWEAIRRKQLAGLRFRRQYPVGPFILDFCCPARRLVVEVDGSAHDGREEQDEDRTIRLASHGYRVLRFRNDAVLGRLPTVLRRIQEEASSAPLPPNPGGPKR